MTSFWENRQILSKRSNNHWISITESKYGIYPKIIKYDWKSPNIVEKNGKYSEQDLNLNYREYLEVVE